MNGIGRRVGATGYAAGVGRVISGRVITVPSLLSVLRLAGVPVFLWLLLGPRADG